MININNNKGNEGFKYTKFIMTLPSLFFIQTCVLTLAVGSKKWSRWPQLSPTLNIRAVVILWSVTSALEKEHEFVFGLVG